MYGYQTSTSSAGAAVVIHNGADNVWMLANTAHSSNIGMITTQSTETYFIGNLIYNIHHPAGSSWDPNSGYSSGVGIHFRNGGTTGGAIHNTLYAYDTGMQLTQGGAAGYDIENNIFSERSESTGWDIRVGESDVASGSTFDYNLIYNSTSAARISWNSSTANDVAQFKSATGKCSNCPAEADPNFVNPAIGNFRLNDPSAAKDVGVAHSIYASFTSRYGIDIMQDIVGNPRTLGAATEIGAFEFVAPIAPPTNPSAILLP